jgi:hypothetical protein
MTTCNDVLDAIFKAEGDVAVVDRSIVKKGNTAGVGDYRLMKLKFGGYEVQLFTRQDGSWAVVD